MAAMDLSLSLFNLLIIDRKEYVERILARLVNWVSMQHLNRNEPFVLLSEIVRGLFLMFGSLCWIHEWISCRCHVDDLGSGGGSSYEEQSARS